MSWNFWIIFSFNAIVHGTTHSSAMVYIWNVLSFTAIILVSSHSTVSSRLYCQESQYCIGLCLKYLALNFSNNFFIPKPVLGLVSTFMPTYTLTNAHVTENIHFGADEGDYDFTVKPYQRNTVFRSIEYLRADLPPLGSDWHWLGMA
jgi:hypothetical protein